MRLFIYIYQIKYILYSRHLQNIIILTIDLFSLPPGTREENVFQLSLGLPLNLTLLKCAKSYPSNKLPSNKWCCAHIHDPNISWLFAFWGVFNVFDKVISMCLGQLPKDLFVLKTFNPLWQLVRIWRQRDIKYALNVLLHL